MEITVVDWDGEQLPGIFRQLPPGRYAIEPLDDVTPLTPEEEDGLNEALDDLEAGGGIPLEEVMDRLRQRYGPP